MSSETDAAYRNGYNVGKEATRAEARIIINALFDEYLKSDGVYDENAEVSELRWMLLARLGL